MSELTTVLVYVVAMPAGVGAFTAAGIIAARRGRVRWRAQRAQLRAAGIQMREDTRPIPVGRRRRWSP